MIALRTNSYQQLAQESASTELLDLYGIKYLYHITHINNLPSILKHGLLSHNQAHQRCALTDISDQEVNARRCMKDPIYGHSLHDYVPLYFNPLNPMSYVRREFAGQLVILKLDRRLLLQENRLFTEGNAACGRTQFFNQLKDLEQLDWDCLKNRYWNDYIDGKRTRCSEVLIPKRIPVSALQQIATNNEKLAHDVLNYTLKGIQVTLQTRLFF